MAKVKLLSQNDVDELVKFHEYLHGKGVYWYAGRVNKWVVLVRYEGKNKYFGAYTNKREANRAYLKALKSLGLRHK